MLIKKKAEQTITTTHYHSLPFTTSEARWKQGEPKRGRQGEGTGAGKGAVQEDAEEVLEGAPVVDDAGHDGGYVPWLGQCEGFTRAGISLPALQVRALKVLSRRHRFAIPAATP